MRSVRIVGPGRAGGSFARALESSGWSIAGLLGRNDDASGAAADVDLVLITTPDAVIDVVAAIIEPGRAVVAHAAGSLGLDVLAPHERRAAVHPLISLPNNDVGAERLLANGWFGIAGDPIAAEVVSDLGGRSFEVADSDRAIYHAAACVAANHVVTLLGQVERLAAEAGVPAAAYAQLALDAVANAVDLGASGALTGPAARGDHDTIARHLDALPAGESELYSTLASAAARLAGQADPTVRPNLKEA